jgi:hypothetical protein
MRVTVDLPPAVHRRVGELAESSGRSVPAMVAELIIRGLSEPWPARVVEFDQRSGFPVVTVGRPITADEVRDLLDE